MRLCERGRGVSFMRSKKCENERNCEASWIPREKISFYNKIRFKRPKQELELGTGSRESLATTSCDSCPPTSILAPRRERESTTKRVKAVFNLRVRCSQLPTTEESLARLG